MNYPIPSTLVVTPKAAPEVMFTPEYEGMKTTVGDMKGRLQMDGVRFANASQITPIQHQALSSFAPNAMTFAIPRGVSGQLSTLVAKIVNNTPFVQTVSLFGAAHDIDDENLPSGVEININWGGERTHKMLKRYLWATHANMMVEAIEYIIEEAEDARRPIAFISLAENASEHRRAVFPTSYIANDTNPNFLRLPISFALNTLFRIETKISPNATNSLVFYFNNENNIAN